ncbi:trigger factor [Candidatus Erwinia haradaeae]|nr:trigger factor [Candidatus Erwinia haradaeae]
MLEQTEGLSKCITLTIDHNIIENAVKNELKSLSKKIRIDGFRLGKVPMHIIIQRYGASVRQDVLYNFMQRYFINTVIQKKWHPSGTPTYSLKENINGKDIVFSVEFNVYPHIDLQGLENIEIEKPIIHITESDVDTMLYMLRQQKANWKESHKSAEKDNRVTLDWTSNSIEHEDFIKKNASNIVLIIGNKVMPSDFEEALIGHKAGEKFIINTNLLKNIKKINSKDTNIQFNVVLKKVETCRLPKFTIDFIKEFGIKDGSLKTLRIEIYKNMQRELNSAIRQFIKLQVINGLVKENNIDIPKNLIDSKVDLVKQQMTDKYSEHTIEESTIPHEVFFKEAKHRILVGLLFGKIIHSYEITADENRVNKLIEEMASAYEDKEKVVSLYHKNTDLMQNIRNAALEEQAVEVVLSQAKITEKFINFQSFMHPLKFH